MPHCIIEYTSEIERFLDLKRLVDVTFDGIEQSGLFDKTAIKVRANKLDYYKSGLDRDDFIHLTIKILPGRTDRQKWLLTDNILDKIEQVVGNTKSTTIEVVDLHKPSYNKRLK